jgi:hypothetical protein
MLDCVDVAHVARHSTRRDRASVQSARDHAAYESRRRPAGLPACPSAAVLLNRACGHHQAALIKCHSPLCPECERERAARIRDKWEPTLAALPELKLVTLTIASGPDLAERIHTLKHAYRRFLDLRLGRNNLRRLARDVEKLIASAHAAGRIDDDKAERWRTQAARWLERIARVRTSNGRSPKIRALIRGLTSLEFTLGEGGWHVHLHCLVSMRYMPHVVLAALWRMATRGAGHVVDIRAIDDVGAGIAETMKYATKSNGVPDDRVPEVLAALKGVRRLTRIGNIKPVEPEAPPCPGCDRPSCECGSLFAGMVDTTNVDINNIELGGFITHIYDNGMSYDARVRLHRNEKGNLVWTATTLAGADMVLSTQLHSVSSEGERAPPTGPPMSMDDCLRELATIRGGLK